MQYRTVYSFYRAKPSFSTRIMCFVSGDNRLDSTGGSVYTQFLKKQYLNEIFTIMIITIFGSGKLQLLDRMRDNP